MVQTLKEFKREVLDGGQILETYGHAVKTGCDCFGDSIVIGLPYQVIYKQRGSDENNRSVLVYPKGQDDLLRAVEMINLVWVLGIKQYLHDGTRFGFFDDLDKIEILKSLEEDMLTFAKYEKFEHADWIKKELNELNRTR